MPVGNKAVNAAEADVVPVPPWDNAKGEVNNCLLNYRDRLCQMTLGIHYHLDLILNYGI